jgi:hypothetical protein
MGEPQQIVSSLEGQVDEILSLYDLAEKAYPYQNLRGDRTLNEDAHRRETVAFSNYGAGSTQIVQGSSLWGFASTYFFSRRGAAHLLDFSTLRKCYFRTFCWYMIGVSIGSLYGVQKTAI